MIPFPAMYLSTERFLNLDALASQAVTPWRKLSMLQLPYLEGWTTEELAAVQSLSIRYHLNPNWEELVAADPPEDLMRAVHEKHRNLVWTGPVGCSCPSI